MLALATLAGLAALGAGLSILGASARPEAASATATGPDRSAWREASLRRPAFDLDAPRWRPLGAHFDALRHESGLVRDVFRFGDATGDTRHAVVVLDRGPIGTNRLDIDLMMLADDLDVPMMLGLGDGTLDTKFGPLSTVDLAVRAGDRRKACLGFGLRDHEARFRMYGWVCSRGPEIVDRREASCLIDRLVLLGAGDPALGRLFQAAELRRQVCPAGLPAVNAGATDQPGHATLRGRTGG
jgi:hypothetical protein